VTAASQRALVDEANARMAPENIDGEQVPTYRARREIWGAPRTAIVLVSKRLQDGQARGVMQHAASAAKWLDDLAATLARGRQRRDRAQLQRDIEARLRGRQFLGRVVKFELEGEARKLSLSHTFDAAAFEHLRDKELGRIVLITDRHDWPTAEVVRTYRSQARIEGVFRAWKDPFHLSLRPQFHWTNQKIRVHVLVCVLAYLLARVLLLRAERTGCPVDSIRTLVDQLAEVRRATVARPEPDGTWQLTTQLEEMDEPTAKLWQALGPTG